MQPSRQKLKNGNLSKTKLCIIIGKGVKESTKHDGSYRLSKTAYSECVHTEFCTNGILANHSTLETVFTND